jgi:hypothetical protein
MGRHQIY